MTTTIIVAVETTPPSPLQDSWKDRVEPGVSEFAAIRRVIGVRPRDIPCVTGLKLAEASTIAVSFVDHAMVAADRTCTEPVIARGLPAFTLIGKVDVIATRGLSAVWTDTETVAVADLVASDTVTLITEVVAAERSFARRTSLGLDVVVGICSPQVVETMGATCTHDQLNVRPALSPETPVLS